MNMAWNLFFRLMVPSRKILHHICLEWTFLSLDKRGWRAEVSKSEKQHSTEYEMQSKKINSLFDSNDFSCFYIDKFSYSHLSFTSNPFTSVYLNTRKKECFLLLSSIPNISFTFSQTVTFWCLSLQALQFLSNNQSCFLLAWQELFLYHAF